MREVQSSRPAWIALDDFHLIGLLKRKRETHPDISATSDNNAAHWFFKASHLTHKDTNVFAIGNKENFVAFLNNGITVRQHGITVTINRRDAAFRIRNMIFQCRNALSNEQAIAVRFSTNKAHAAIGEIQNLRRPGIQNELLNMRADQLFWTDSNVDGNGVLREQLAGIHILS